MNSLLQALYMNPEFRLMIYSWEYDEKKNPNKKDCIIYQLQKLFATLQILQSQQEQEDENQSHKVLRNAETVELTGSFQWDYREAMEQHDVAEFCMQLFDAIE